MKTSHIFFFIILLLSSSCQKGRNNEKQTQIQLPDLSISEHALMEGSDSIELNSLKRLSQQEYDSLQIQSIEDFIGYDLQDLSIGRVLFDSEEGKIISIHIITEGELTEFLLSYDKYGNPRDKLLVAYEDLVENYSQITSTIKSGTITIQTVNYFYNDEDSIESETADTVIANYKISPELRFISN